MPRTTSNSIASRWHCWAASCRPFRRQNFHRTFRLFQIEADEGNRRSETLMRASLLHDKDVLDGEIQKVIDLLNKLTQDTAQQAKAEERVL